jgi:type IV pilus assembly protein PilN
MIRINLLPFRSARKKENVRRQISIFVLGGFLVAVSLFGYHLLLGSRVATQDQKVADAKADLAQLEKKLNEIKEMKKMLETIRRKTAVIENLELSRQAAVRLLDAMAHLTVADRMYLTELKISGNMVEMGGIAADNQTIAGFMTRLEESGLFKKVALRSTSANPQKDGNVLQKFSISGDRKPLERTGKPNQAPEKAEKK